jgi:prepilin-type processing-associated H-X9-DG protein
VVLFEADLGKNGVGSVDDMVFRHQSCSGQPGCNVLFADGHVELITEDQLHTLQW